MQTLKMDGTLNYYIFLSEIPMKVPFPEVNTLYSFWTCHTNHRNYWLLVWTYFTRQISRCFIFAGDLCEWYPYTNHHCNSLSICAWIGHVFFKFSWCMFWIWRGFFTASCVCIREDIIWDQLYYRVDQSFTRNFYINLPMSMLHRTAIMKYCTF